MKKVLFFLLMFSSLGIFARDIDANSIVALIGQDVRGPHLQSWLKNSNSSPLVNEYDNGDSLYYNYHYDGMSLLFDKGHLAAVFLYAEGKEGFRQFTGQMPYKLGFTMTKSEIDKLLGAPTKKGAVSVYGSKYIGITYEKNVKNPRPNVIQFF